jgi:hypothetical protein
MEVKVNGFKYSALYSGDIACPTFVANNFSWAVFSSINNLTLPEVS